MNKRIRKKKMVKKRNESRKQILSMNDGDDKYRMLMLHAIRFNDCGFVYEVIGPGPHYIIMPRMNGKILFRRLMLEYLKRSKNYGDGA